MVVTALWQRPSRVPGVCCPLQACSRVCAGHRPALASGCGLGWPPAPTSHPSTSPPCGSAELPSCCGIPGGRAQGCPQIPHKLLGLTPEALFPRWYVAGVSLSHHRPRRWPARTAGPRQSLEQSPCGPSSPLLTNSRWLILHTSLRDKWRFLNIVAPFETSR